MTPRIRILALASALTLIGAACAEPDPQTAAFSGDIAAGNPTAVEEEHEDPSGAAPEAEAISASDAAALDAVLANSPGGCEFLDTASCLLPFPSDTLSEPDTSSATGRSLNLPQGQFANTDGVPLDMTAWNERDGFSPSTPILVVVPGVDAEQSGFASQTEIQKSIEADSPTVLVDLDSGQLVPHWAELDSRATSPENRALIIRPAISLPETHRIGVALRNLKDAEGNTIPAPVQYRTYRDNLTTSVEAVEGRRAAHEVVFGELATAGVNRADLYLSWWFTVASADSLAGNLLDMRDDAIGALNGGAPKFAVTDVTTDDLESGIAKIVSGTFEVPLYLDSDEPGARLNLDSAGVPTSDATYTANFICAVPEEALAGGEARPVVYGHGLLGGADEVESGHVQVTAATGNFVYCGTDTIGMSEGDINYVGGVLTNLNLFPAVPERLQQGILNSLYLARLMVHFEGLGSSEEFTTSDGATVFNTTEAYFDGNSQGAISGGAVTAVGQDFGKSSLGVGGMNYSLLLNRSVDFNQFFTILEGAYTNPLEQQILFGVMQILWDSGETAGYVQHMTSRTYRRTPPKDVLMSVAFGDHQVANVSADIIARTLDIPIYEPTLPADADDAPNRFYDLGSIDNFPHVGSALYYWYSGTLAPPNGNITPIMGPLFAQNCSGAAAEEKVECMDPHEDPRRSPKVMEQKDEFFRPDGVVVNVCADKPCEAQPRGEYDY